MFTRIVDEEIQLALLQPSFAPLYAQLVQENEAYLSQWLAWPPHCKTENDFKAFIKKSLHEYAEGTNMYLSIFYYNQLVGNVGFNTIDYALKKVIIGYWLAEKLQGKGIMTRCCQYLIHIAFKELGMDKVQISAATGNQPSRAVCERLGMQLEGIITHNENLNGRIVDHAIYGLKRT